jgi:hypothetical protein
MGTNLLVLPSGGCLWGELDLAGGTFGLDKDTVIDAGGDSVVELVQLGASGVDAVLLGDVL